MRLWSVLALSAAVIASFPLAAQTPASAPSAGQTHREPPRPKNLQVLPKDISTHDLIATMRGYTKALGVECSFCHAEDPQTHRLDFASDAKPEKHTARTMIRMTNEINAKFLATVDDPDASAEQKTVTCGTCHRGQMMPPPFQASSKAEEHHGAPTKMD